MAVFYYATDARFGARWRLYRDWRSIADWRFVSFGLDCKRNEPQCKCECECPDPDEVLKLRRIHRVSELIQLDSLKPGCHLVDK